VKASYQYFLRKQDLPLLHQAYDIYYEDVMETMGVDAIKVRMYRYITLTHNV